MLNSDDLARKTSLSELDPNARKCLEFQEINEERPFSDDKEPLSKMNNREVLDSHNPAKDQSKDITLKEDSKNIAPVNE